MGRALVVGVMGAGNGARSQDVTLAFELGAAIARKGWVLLSGGHNSGVMDAVNKGARQAGGLTVGITRESNFATLSEAVSIGIATGMCGARNNINILSSDAIIACGHGGPGTASEIALAILAKKNVILLQAQPTGTAFFKEIGGAYVHLANTVDQTMQLIENKAPQS